MVKDYAGADKPNARNDPLDDARDIRLPIMHHRQDGKR
jgi:hypothetical protein